MYQQSLGRKHTNILERESCSTYSCGYQRVLNQEFDYNIFPHSYNNNTLGYKTLAYQAPYTSCIYNGKFINVTFISSRTMTSLLIVTFFHSSKELKNHGTYILQAQQQTSSLQSFHPFVSGMYIIPPLPKLSFCY